MDCLDPIAPNDEELLRYAIDKEEMPWKVEEHFEQCEICQQRFTQYERVHGFLVSSLYRSTCPSGIELSLYCAGELSGDERMGIARHLLECPLCAKEVADTRQFMRAVPIFEPLRENKRRVFAKLIRRQAQLVVRSEAKSLWPRQYHSEPIDLSLHLSRASSGEFMLLGILTSTDSHEDVGIFEGVDVDLYNTPGPLDGEGGVGEMPLLSTRVDDLGNLVFSSVPIGKYVMMLHLRDKEVVIEDLVIEHG